MKLVTALSAIIGALAIAGLVRAETVHTRLTKKSVGDHLYSFTVKVERIKDRDAGEVLQFSVTAKPKDAKAPGLPHRIGTLAVYDGKSFVSACKVEATKGGGGLAFSFRVAAKYADKSRFTFGETLGDEGEGQGFYYWFYLKDFSEPNPEPE